MREEGAVAFLAVLVLGVLVMVFCLVFASQKPAGGAGQGPSAPAQMTAAQFWQGLAQRPPKYGTATYNCPVTGDQIDVPTLTERNAFGGIATDLMEIMLMPPAEGRGRPEFDGQPWEKLLVTCPVSGATFMEADLFNLRQGLVPGGQERLKEWDLAAVAPSLAEVPSEEWTGDERAFVRYLTTRHAGFPDSELGFYALHGAYVSNFAVWYGKDHVIPGAAFYALASAHLARAFDEPLNDEARAIVAMTRGELRRLLGDQAGAQAMFALAREIYEDYLLTIENQMQAAEAGNAMSVATKLHKRIASSLDVLTQLETLTAEEDYFLSRAEVAGRPEPPVGWYIEEMLPAINGELVADRGDWVAEDDPAVIVERILELLP